MALATGGTRVINGLQNAVERAIVLVRGDRIGVADLQSLHEDLAPGSGVELLVQGRPTLYELEERYMDLVLKETDGDKTKAAQILGVSTRTLYRRDKR